MELSDFHYELPEGAIALHPASPRDSCRLLSVDKKTGERRHLHFHDLPTLLRAGDILVLNTTGVLPARLRAKTEEGKEVETFLLKKESELSWKCLLKPAKKVRDTLVFSDGTKATVEKRGKISLLYFEQPVTEAWLEIHGSIPLPPYLKRSVCASDRDDYQTVFSQEKMSVAAPTAGLHFTDELLKKLGDKGVELVNLKLEIGYGTFSPIESLADSLHEENFEISRLEFEKLERAKKEGRRIIAVGTTSLRAMESIETCGLRGSTQLFIRPGFKFRWVDGLITNFHLPESSLLVLVAAFLGRETVLDVYQDALKRGYRVFSYGDAMVVV